MSQKALLEKLTSIILKIKKPHPVRICIDGVDASGKTKLADNLVEYLKKSSRPIIRASIDGFHNPKEIRYRKGEDSPEGYYHDTTNYEAVIKNLLKPLSPNGDLQYQTRIFDFIKDTGISTLSKKAKPNSILIMEGVFLQRPELLPYWDLKIFIDANFNTTLARATKRDGYYLGSQEEIIYKYNQRYIPGQQIYLKTVQPQEKADIVIDNNDYNHPKIIKAPCAKSLPQWQPSTQTMPQQHTS